MPADTFADAATGVRVNGARQRAIEMLMPRYAVAAHDRAVAAYLASAPIAELIERLTSAMIAADHFAAQVPCPGRWMRKFRGAAWKRYVEQRTNDGVTLCARLLADWCIWRCIPEQWLPRELVFAGVKQRLRRSGFEVLEMTGSLRPAVPGGEAGLRASCKDDHARLPERCARGPVVAVLYREAGPEIVVLEAVAPNLPEFALGPEVVAPPRSIGVRTLGKVGADRWWWARLRRWRTRSRLC